MNRPISVGLLVLVGSAVLAACGDDKASPLAEVEGGPCSVEWQKSACASSDPNTMASCGPCQGHWLICQSGKWFAVHCDPLPPPDPRPDAAIDANDAADVPQGLDGKALDTTSLDTGSIDGLGSPIDGVLRGYLVFASYLAASKTGPANCPLLPPVFPN
jgi:hypothetical protein